MNTSRTVYKWTADSHVDAGSMHNGDVGLQRDSDGHKTVALYTASQHELAIDAAYYYVCVAWSVCLSIGRSVCHDREPRKNG